MTVILIFVLATGFVNINVQMPEMDGLQLQNKLPQRNIVLSIL